MRASANRLLPATVNSWKEIWSGRGDLNSGPPAPEIGRPRCTGAQVVESEHISLRSRCIEAHREAPNSYSNRYTRTDYRLRLLPPLPTNRLVPRTAQGRSLLEYGMRSGDQPSGKLAPPVLVANREPIQLLPAKPPEEVKRREARRHAERIEDSLKTHARVTALARRSPKYPSAFVDRVLKRTTRPGDRSYGVRFPWARAIVEKTTQLVGEGGVPEFCVRILGPSNNPPEDASEREDESITMALRHESRHGDGPYTAHAGSAAQASLRHRG